MAKWTLNGTTGSKKKKSSFIYTEEKPQGSLTRGQTVTRENVPTKTPVPPPKRIQLTPEAQKAVLMYGGGGSSNAPVTWAESNKSKPSIKKLDGGKYSLVFPGGREFTGTMAEVSLMKSKWETENPVENPQLTSMKENYALQKEFEKYKAEQTPTPETVTQEQLNNLTTLTPEQLMRSQTDLEMEKNPDLKQVLAMAGERAATGAVGGAVTGAAGGSLAGGVGAIPGAIGLGVGAGVVGGVSGIFAAYKDVASDNVKGIDDNVANAKSAFSGALRLANQGGDYEQIQTMVSEAIVQLNRAERQYKEQSKNLYEYKTDAKLKLQALEIYRKNIMPGMIDRIQIGLQKPNPSYLDNGLMEGDLIG
jgi:uncharacterized membrane protein